MTVGIVAHGVTDVGRVHDGNEDGFRVDDRMDLVAVADGMGGHRAGEVASATALEALRAAVASGRPIREAITLVNDAVIEKAATDENLRGMGTTLTAATLASGGTLLIGHVGDSRAYLARDGGLTQITVDHSLVEEMVRGGMLTPEQAEVHPQKSTITRAIGIDPDIEVDLYPVELRLGDRVLLCSDGLSNMLRPEEIVAILGREPDGQRAAELLVDAANAAGGEDNITAVIIDAVDDPGPARAPVLDAEIVDDELPMAADQFVRPAAPPRRRARRVGRILLWTLPVVAVLALAVGAVAWYARHSYYVGFHSGVVTIYKGVPGGILAWDPTIEREFPKLKPGKLTQVQRLAVNDHAKFSSYGEANTYVQRLLASVASRTVPSTTAPTPTTTTATTAPATTTPPATFPAPPAS